MSDEQAPQVVPPVKDRPPAKVESKAGRGDMAVVPSKSGEYDPKVHQSKEQQER